MRKSFIKTQLSFQNLNSPIDTNNKYYMSESKLILAENKENIKKGDIAYYKPREFLSEILNVPEQKRYPENFQKCKDKFLFFDEDSKIKHILTLDGGGLKTIFGAHILERLAEDLKHIGINNI